jgi:hypothetical protein
MELLVRIILSINPLPGVQISGDDTGSSKVGEQGGAGILEQTKPSGKFTRCCNTVLTT